MRRPRPHRVAPQHSLGAILLLGILLSARRVEADMAFGPDVLFSAPLLVFFLTFLVAAVARLLLAWLRTLVTRARRGASGEAADGVPVKRGFARAFRAELLIALVFSGVAFAASVVGYREAQERRLVRQARRSVQSEAVPNLVAIWRAEVEYFAEWDVYVGNQPFTPIARRAGDDRKPPWDGTTRFSVLGFAPEGNVACSYRLGGPDWPTDGFTATAQCNDRDGKVVVWTIDSATDVVKESGGLP